MEEPYQDERTEELRKKVMPLPEEPREGNFLEDLRRLTLSTIRMESMTFDGTVTMLLRVVAPQTPVMIDGF